MVFVTHSPWRLVIKAEVGLETGRDLNGIGRTDWRACAIGAIFTTRPPLDDLARRVRLSGDREPVVDTIADKSSIRPLADR